MIIKCSMQSMLSSHLEISYIGTSTPNGEKISVGFYIEVLTEVCTAYLHWHIPDLVFHCDLPKYNLGSQSVL